MQAGWLASAERYYGLTLLLLGTAVLVVAKRLDTATPSERTAIVLKAELRLAVFKKERAAVGERNIVVVEGN